MAFLKVIEGCRKGQFWEIKEPYCVLGRHPDCDVPIDYLDASRHHARIVFLGGEYFLEDLHSHNGTWLNRQNVRKRQKLAEGDTIRISQTVLEFFHGMLDGAAGPRARAVIEDRGGPSGPAEVIQCEVPANRESNRSGLLMRAELEALLEIAQSLRKTLNLYELCPLVLESALKVFPAADRGALLIVDEAGNPEVREVTVRRGPADQEVRLSSAITRRVMELQQAVLSADAAADFRFKSSESLAETPIRSVMCAPLVDARGRSFGVLQVDTIDQRGQFQESDLNVLAAVAVQASMALDHARLHEQALRQREIERDLELADQIQRSFLPSARPQIPAYRFFDYYRPAKTVGGDHYNYVSLPDGRLAIVVADVMGRGLGAAMLIAKLAAEVRYHVLSSSAPAQATARINEAISSSVGENQFITLLLMVLDPPSGRLRLVTAGHPPALLCPPGGTASAIGTERMGFPLGAFQRAGYEEVEVHVPPGSLILAYTDGVIEATGAAKQAYGLPRLCQQLQSASGDPLCFGNSFVKDVNQFVADQSPEDDICLVCFGRDR
jgi:sigma-B regulation protein RsbU (phosphoserine phosphatase)